MAKPHDRLIKHILEQPMAALALLRERLDPSIAALLAPDAPTLLAASHVDEQLHATRSDRVVRARLALSPPRDLLCVIEHRSTPGGAVLKRLLRYVDREWDGVKIGQGFVTALVIYNGRRRWRAPLSFRDEAAAGAPSSLRKGQIDLTADLFDLGAVADEKLSADPSLRAGLLALKYGTRPDEQKAKVMAIVEATRAAPELQEAIFRYLRKVFPEPNRAALMRAIDRHGPGARQMMTSIAEVDRAKARREGKREGKREGEREGERRGERKGERKVAEELLMRLLEKRFLTIPAARRREISSASVARLKRLVERTVDAPDLASVFRP